MVAVRLFRAGWNPVLGLFPLPGNGPIRAPSLEVVNVAGDSAVGGARSQSAPNLQRVQAESAQQHRCRIWWLESEDLGQYLLGRDPGLPAHGLDRFLEHFRCHGRHAEAIFRTALIVGFFGPARPDAVRCCDPTLVDIASCDEGNTDGDERGGPGDENDGPGAW